MSLQVIVPLDGSTNAEAMLPHALFFALQTQSVLTLLRVIMPPGEPEHADRPAIPDNWSRGEVMWTKNYLSSLATRLRPHGVRVQIEHVEGTSAGAAITSYATQHTDIWLIALASHGRSLAGQLLLGSVARKLYASAPTSVLLLHPPKDRRLPDGSIPPASYQTIVVPLDGIVSSERVLAQAVTLAQVCHASLLLVADPPPPLLEPGVRVHEEMREVSLLAEQAGRLRLETGLSVQTAFTDGSPETFIERLQEASRHDLLIVTRRRQEEHRVMEFLHESNVPVLFVA